MGASVHAPRHRDSPYIHMFGRSIYEIRLLKHPHSPILRNEQRPQVPSAVYPLHRPYNHIFKDCVWIFSPSILPQLGLNHCGQQPHWLTWGAYHTHSRPHNSQIVVGQNNLQPGGAVHVCRYKLFLFGKFPWPILIHVNACEIYPKIIHGRIQFIWRG